MKLILITGTISLNAFCGINMNMRHNYTPIENYTQTLKNNEDEMIAVIEKPGFAKVLAFLEKNDITSTIIDMEAGVNSDNLLPDLIEWGIIEKRQMPVGEKELTLYSLTPKGYPYGVRAKLYLEGLRYVTFETIHEKNQINLKHNGESYKEKDWGKLSILRLPRY